jgi:hypothetical protein
MSRVNNFVVFVQPALARRSQLQKHAIRPTRRFPNIGRGPRRGTVLQDGLKQLLNAQSSPDILVRFQMPFDRGTLLENVLRNLRQSEVDEIVLVPGFSADTIRREIPLDGVLVVVNEGYCDGMGVSLRSGIAVSVLAEIVQKGRSQLHSPPWHCRSSSWKPKIPSAE